MSFLTGIMDIRYGLTITYDGFCPLIAWRYLVGLPILQISTTKFIGFDLYLSDFGIQKECGGSYLLSPFSYLVSLLASCLKLGACERGV